MRAWRKGAKGKYYPSDIERLRKRQMGICYYCHADLEERFQVDYKIPLSRGGANTSENIVLACPSCNQRKGAMTDAEFIDSMKSG